MAKSLNTVHKALEKKRMEEAMKQAEQILAETIKADILAELEERAEEFLSDDVFVGQKAILLLSLKPEGFGKARAERILDRMDSTEQALRKPEEGKPDNSINWQEVLDQVKEEYDIDLRERYGIGGDDLGDGK